jgi:pectinesterase
LGVAAVLALGSGACSGGGQTTKQDTGVMDAPAQVDTPTGTDTPAGTDTPTEPDGGVEDAQADAGIEDALPPMDAPGVECAPVPTGGPTPAGTAPMQDAGAVVTSTATRPELPEALADSTYTIRKALAQGYLINGGAAPDGGVGPVTYSLNDGWDPLTNGIGNPATFTPMFTVALDGSGTHTSLQTAFAAANALASCSRVYIRLMPGEHRGQLVLPSKTSAPPITIYSTESDASKTVIVANQSAATAGNMSASATLTVKAIRGFQMKNLTVANDYVEDSAAPNQSAVAMLLQTDKSQFENVRFIGNIGTLYVKSSSELVKARSYFRDCYIEGDQDFIVGRGTAVFDHCEIKYVTGRMPTGGNIGNPSTLVFNDYGFLFDSCTFTAETGASGVTLGRQWLEESDTVSLRGLSVGKMIVRNSTLGAHLAGAAPWSLTGARTTTPKNPDVDAGQAPVLVYTSDDYFPAGVGPTPAEPYLGEYRNTGAGAHQ